MIWLLIALALIAAALLFLLRFGYKLAFYYDDPCKDPLDYSPSDQVLPVKSFLDEAVTEFMAAPQEDISITSFDGLTLTGKYFHTADGAPLQIFCHGYKGNAIRDFCGGWRIARSLGHNVILIDQRCHGGSQGHTITFGIRERRDVLSWVAYARKRFGDVPMILSGVSMGAATVLMAGDLALPDNVKGIIADCPFDSPENIIRKVLGQDMGMPVAAVYPLIRLGGMVFGGFDLKSAAPLTAVPRAKVPILLIHGDADRFVPYDMSVAIHNAAPDKIRFHTIPGAGHALNFVTAPEEYTRIVKDFLQSLL